MTVSTTLRAVVPLFPLLALLSSACSSVETPAAPVEEKPTAPTVETFELPIDEPQITRGGITVLLKAAGHKQMKGGGSTSMWELSLTREGVEHRVDYRYSDGDLRWYFETFAFGNVVAVESLFPLNDDRRILTDKEDLERNDRRRVTLTPHEGLAPKPEVLKDRASALAEAEADRRKCVSEFAASSSGYGTLNYSRYDARKPECKILVGLYTGTLYYQASDGRLEVQRKPAP